MRRAPQLLLGAVVLGPWLLVSARDQLRAARLGESREATAKIGEIIAGAALARQQLGDAADSACPLTDGTPSFAAGPTPPLDVACARGPGGRCRARLDEARLGPGDYPTRLWGADPLWSLLGVRVDGPHAYHYAAEIADADGRCEVTVTARGDLDGDGVMSTIGARAALAADLWIERRWALEDPLE